MILKKKNRMKFMKNDKENYEEKIRSKEEEKEKIKMKQTKEQEMKMILLI